VTALRNYKLQVLQFQNGKRLAEDDCEAVGCAIELLLKVSKFKILNSISVPGVQGLQGLKLPHSFEVCLIYPNICMYAPLIASQPPTLANMSKPQVCHVHPLGGAGVHSPHSEQHVWHCGNGCLEVMNVRMEMQSIKWDASDATPENCVGCSRPQWNEVPKADSPLSPSSKC